MSVPDIIAGIVLVLTSIIIIAVTLMQSEKQQGMTSAISGTNNDSFYGKNSGNTREKALERLTAILTAIYFIVTLAVNIISAFNS